MVQYTKPEPRNMAVTVIIYTGVFALTALAFIAAGV